MKEDGENRRTDVIKRTQGDLEELDKVDTSNTNTDTEKKNSWTQPISNAYSWVKNLLGSLVLLGIGIAVSGLLAVYCLPRCIKWYCHRRRKIARNKKYTPVVRFKNRRADEGSPEVIIGNTLRRRDASVTPPEVPLLSRDAGHSPEHDDPRMFSAISQRLF
jgi:hypothetical protein